LLDFDPREAGGEGVDNLSVALLEKRGSLRTF
jgi:hypothetical protein